MKQPGFKRTQSIKEEYPDLHNDDYQTEVRRMMRKKKERSSKQPSFKRTESIKDEYAELHNDDYVEEVRRMMRMKKA